MHCVVQASKSLTRGVRTNLSRRRNSWRQWSYIMLELRPTCENCNKPLPPNSPQAWICSYECTFCSQCVDEVLGNVCPNCGGGFVARPVRPARNWRDDNYL